MNPAVAAITDVAFYHSLGFNHMQTLQRSLVWSVQPMALHEGTKKVSDESGCMWNGVMGSFKS